MKWLEIVMVILAVPLMASFYPLLAWLGLRSEAKALARREAAWERAAAQVNGVHIRHETHGFRMIRRGALEVAVKDKVVSGVTGTTIPLLRVRLPISSLDGARPKPTDRLQLKGAPIPRALLAVLEDELLASRRPEDVELTAHDGQLTIHVRNENLVPDQVHAWLTRASRWASVANESA